eukprot:7219557-Alexandrium_andersonii.AAC.1
MTRPGHGSLCLGKKARPQREGERCRARTHGCQEDLRGTPIELLAAQVVSAPGHKSAQAGAGARARGVYDDQRKAGTRSQGAIDCKGPRGYRRLRSAPRE